ncbi:hypothetical protein [Bacillus sp. FJAT-42315]|uniref:hypothetical protein n=1 Tax=Bacillus sp. FJAT-42315 TaxID=2014077 RepID=UPI000C24605C|nr:hypothetical protein [Bacillus sp. FJAT-42315]
MKKILWPFIMLLSIVVLTGCGTPQPEEVDTYRAKQLVASYYGSFDKMLGSSEEEEELTDFQAFLRDMGDYGNVMRTTRILEGQSLSRRALVNDPQAMRKLSFAWGEGDLKYHFQLPGDEERWVTGTFSATTMTTYNLSYLVNLPAKLIANIRLDIYMWKNADDFERLTNIVAKGSAITFIALDIFYAIIGFLVAIIMLPIGLILGFLTSPIQTFLDIFPVLFDSLKTLYYAVRNLFY